MKFFSGRSNGLASFYKAFLNCRREMAISLLILLFITVLLAFIFYRLEHKEQPDVFDGIWSCVVWAHSRYIESGDGVFEGGPVTVAGRTIAFLLGLIGIALVAIPAGLVGSGFNDAIAEEKRAKKIEEYKDNLELAFREVTDVAFREHIQKHPGLCTLAKGTSGFYIPSFVPLATVQLRYGMEMKDVFDTAEKHPEFRVVNLAAMKPIEDEPADRIVITHQHINSSYGCFIDRGSKITIVSPSSVLETLTGWFGHYLALVGGFNFISKEIEPNIGDFDSYAVLADEITVNGYTKQVLEKNKSKNSDKLKLYDKKKKNREKFLKDLKSVCRGEDSWLIYIHTSIMNKSNKNEFHFTMSKVKDEEPMVSDANVGTYQKLVKDFTQMAKMDFGYSAVTSDRYPLPAGFSGYKLKQESPDLEFNAFKINIGAPVITDNSRMILIYKMAQTINESLGGTGMTAYDAKYLTSRHFGLRDYHPEEVSK